MSTLSLLWQKYSHRWYRLGIDGQHGLRRHLAFYVARHGFEIGDYSYGTPIIRHWGGRSRLVVGRYRSIADGVEFILGGNHRVERVTYPMSMLYGRPAEADHTWSRGDIIVGSDVWIGVGAVVLSGLKMATAP